MLNKKLKENKYFQIGITAFIVIACSLITYFCLFKTKDIIVLFSKIIKVFTPFIIGFIIAYLLNPIVEFFKKCLLKLFKNKSKKFITNLSILITCLLFLIIIVLLFSFIIPELLISIEKLAVNLPFYFEEIKNYLLEKLSSSELKTIILNNYETINSYLNNVVNTSLLPKVDSWLVNLSSGVIGAVKTVFNIFMGFVISIYLLSDKDTFISGTKKIVYSVFSIKTGNKIIEIAQRTNEIFSSFIIGVLLDALVIGGITFVFLTLFGYPYALLIGVIVGTTNMIPYFGPFIGAIPSALLILMDDPTKCLIFILFIIVLQQTDGYIIKPKLCGSKTGLKSFWVLASILLFGNIFGIVGMLIAVPIFALIYGYLDNLITNSLKKKGLPTHNEDYLKLKKVVVNKNKSNS
jgi:predicted PurR-regulated permease PerM